MRKLLLLLGPALLLAAPARAQKAYDAVAYTGQTQHVRARLTLANGYLGASEIITTDAKTGKRSRFRPAASGADKAGQLRFGHVAATTTGRFTDYFMVEGLAESFDTAPRQLRGRYVFRGTAYPITWTRR